MPTTTTITQEDMAKLTKEVAANISLNTMDEWTLSPEVPVRWAPSAKIARDDKAALMLIAEGDRVKVSGYYYGMTMAGYVTKPPGDITVALQRGPRAIAREINNRILPQYLES